MRLINLPNGERITVAARDIKMNEELMFVPFEKCVTISQKSKYEKYLDPAAATTDDEKMLFNQSKSALFLMELLKNENSWFKPYLDTLPKTLPYRV